MTKREFLETLNARAAALPESERARLVAYFTEIIDDSLEDGVPEEEAVAALGSPDELLREVQPGDAPAPKPLSGERVDALRSLNICTKSADVTIRRMPLEDGAAAQLQFSDPQRFTWHMNGDVLEIVENEPETGVSLFGLRLPFGSSNIQTVTVALDVALEGAVDASSAAGDLIAEGLEVGEAMRLNSHSGDIKLRGCACGGSVRLRSLSGDIEVRDTRGGEMHLTTASGDIEFDRGQADAAYAKTASGDVRFDELEAADQLAVETASGDIDLARSIAPQMRLNAVSGDIDVRLPNAAGKCDIHADTRSGSIRLPRKWTPAENDAACDVRANTVSGDINVAIVE